MRLVLFGLLLVASAVARSAAEGPAVPAGILTLDGRAAPALRLADMDGKVFDLAQASGRWIFVHFWATWCAPCRREMPTLQRMAELLQPAGMVVILVNTAETDDAVFTFLGIVAPELPTLMDYDGAVTERWQPRGLPATFLVDPSRRLRYLALGGRDWDSPTYLGFLRGLLAHGAGH